MFCNDIISGNTILKIGDHGDYVFVLQGLLTRLGYPISMNGIFNTKTEHLVIDYQVTNGVTPDGVVGTHTATSLCGKSSNSTNIPKNKTQYTYFHIKNKAVTPTNTLSFSKTNTVPLPGTGFIKLPTEQAISAKIKSLPSWLWYVIIGGGLLFMMGGK